MELERGRPDENGPEAFGSSFCITYWVSVCISPCAQSFIVTTWWPLGSQSWCSCLCVISSPSGQVGHVICVQPVEYSKGWSNIALAMMPHRIVISVWQGDSLPGWPRWSRQPHWGRECGKNLRMASSQQLARNWGLQSYNHKDLNSANNDVTLEAGPSPVKLEVRPSSGQHLII